MRGLPYALADSRDGDPAARSSAATRRRVGLAEALLAARLLGSRDPSADRSAGDGAAARFAHRRAYARRTSTRSRMRSPRSRRVAACSVAMSGALHVEAAGHGPPLVLLHGWAMHSGVWGGLAAALAQRHRVHAVGSAGARPQRAGSTPFTVDAVVGRSTRRSRRSARRSTVRRLVAGRADRARAGRSRGRSASRGSCSSRTTPRFVAGDGWADAMSRQTLERFGDELEVAWKRDGAALSHAADARQRARSRGARARCAASSSRAASRRARRCARRSRCSSTTDLRAEAARVAQPALVVAGERDTLAPAGGGRWLAAAMPNGRFAAIDGAAHVPFLSHPDAFGRALAEFLDAR